jgi:hypothetical protein
MTPSRHAMQSARLFPLLVSHVSRDGNLDNGALDALLDHVLVLIVLLLVLIFILKPGLHLGLPEPVLHALPLLALPPRHGRCSVHLEAKDSWLEAALRLGGQHVGVDLEQDVVERGAKVSAIDAGVARRLRIVDVFAAPAVELDGGRVGHVGLAHGEEGLRVAHDARAFAKVGLFELLEHFCQAPRCDDVARVHEAVEVPRRLLDGLAHVVVAVEVEDVGHEVEGILVVLDLGVEAREVEAVGEVLFVDLAEVLVAARGDELPTSAWSAQPSPAPVSTLVAPEDHIGAASIIEGVHHATRCGCSAPLAVTWRHSRLAM